MKGFIKIEFVMPVQAKNWIEAEYQANDIVYALRKWNLIKKYGEIEETSVDCTEFEEGTENGVPYL